MLICDVPPKQTNFIEKRGGALWDKACENCFCLRLLLPLAGSSRSIHKTPPTSQCFHFVNSRCYQVREYCFAHRTHVGNRHRRNIELQSVRAAQKQGARTSCATLALYDSENPCTSRPLLSNIYTGTFCALLALFVAGWLCSSIVLRSR